MKKRHARHLVLGYLERIASTAFEKFPRQITHLANRQHGLYALYKNERLYYVGLATNLRNRVKSHLKDRHSGKWDRFSLYLIRHADHIREMESLILHIADPTGNTQAGRLRHATDLLKKLKTNIRAEQDRQLGLVVGDPDAQREQRTNSPVAQAWRRKKRQQIRRRRLQADTIVVPARESGFQETFLGKNCWYAVRIRQAMIPRIKYVAAYRSRPISAITHYARVARIEEYKKTGKMILHFKGDPHELKPVPLGDHTPVQGPVFARFSRLQRARKVDDLF